ncbi:MAG TPA: tetratricopeptide repeat protein [Acidobacteriaceae bacterium]|jgi:tetratricopeptide (TPR) repeat protein
MHRFVSQIPMAIVAAMMMGFAGVPMQGQQVGEGRSLGATQDTRPDAPFPDRPELMRRIALYEAAERSAERSHPGLESMVKVYSNLATLYEHASLYPKAEEALHKEIAVLGGGPQVELADAFGHLAVLHVAMGDLHQAEKDDGEALRIREGIGDPVGIALTWSDLGDIEVKERHFKQAEIYSHKALAILQDNPKAEVSDRIAAQQTLAYALCGLRRCGEAIPLLQETLELQKKLYGPDSLLVGSGYFLLGHAYWQNGDLDTAAGLMRRGTARMKVDLGWGHSIYLDAMSEYARFLRQRGDNEAAASAEREIKTANAVVDARSLTPRTSTFSAGGPR